MHLFLRDRRRRWLSVLLVAAGVLLVLAAAFTWSRVDRSEILGFLAQWNGPEATQREGDISASLGSATSPSAAESADVREQIALARSYADLGQRLEGLQVLERLAQAHPQDGEIAFIHASLLSQGSDPAELETAFELYETAAARSPRLGDLARLHQGVIRVRLGDAPGGVRIWRDQLALQPEQPYRSLFQDAIARAGG